VWKRLSRQVVFAILGELGQMGQLERISQSRFVNRGLGGGSRKVRSSVSFARTSCESTSSFQVRVGAQILVATSSRTTLHHTKSDLLGLPDVLGSSRACRWHLPTWQAHRCGRNFGCFRAALQSDHTGMPRSLAPILSASQKPKGGEPPIHTQDTTEHRQPDAASRGGHTHRRGSR
jgi:hypothetical protein